MKKAIAAGLFVACGLRSTAANAKESVVEGVIVGYECGDNRYLTITDARGKERGGLCAAPLCRRWNESADMPAKCKGGKVRVTVGERIRYDGGGRAMGKMDAFETIELLKSR